ncbi:uncharacterized protein LOC108744452 isoform X2 [Agrilus planipennis]|uniref:Uncharacterized protein LOC108744452 isoform X2 n=1 Tax=Agrilus planipennis TaxID=224129 RepID=A0A1W4XHX4_AGRPL|nr:uncharacterized protein LOC108744452 isoform X2 [Agrilus planipennis]
MAILDTYYRLIEKKPERVSKIWQGRKKSYDVELPVKNAEIEWPIRETWCNFCTTAFVLSFIYCAFWITLFMLCPKGGGGHKVGILQQAWKIVFPTLIFSLLFIIIMLIALFKVKNGLYSFCYQLAASLLYEECSSQIDIYSLSFSQKEQSIFLYIQICIYSAYVSCLCWIAQMIMLIIRILFVVDFTVLKISLIEGGDKHDQQKVDRNSPELKPLTSPEGVQIFQKKCPSQMEQGTKLYQIHSSSVSLESEEDTLESRV